jgi:divalent metal cation (Fe/Co/Zn/Cd) transporter
MVSMNALILEHVLLIVGKTANVEFLQKITYVAMTHDSRVLQVDTARAYHAGANFFVEVDIVLPPEMSLHEAHDIGEALQVKLENMPMVERAFVHLDYETSHAPEHRKTR